MASSRPGVVSIGCGMKFLYLLEAASGEIKIGCSENPWRRQSAIDLSSPHPVRLIAKWPGSHEEERELHKRFRDLGIHREWYRNEGELTAFVDGTRGLGLNDKPHHAVISEMPPAEKQAYRTARATATLRALWADPTFREMQRRAREARR